MTIGELVGNPLNRPSGTFSPTGEKAGVRGRTDDSTAAYRSLIYSYDQEIFSHFATSIAA